jgi:hypothetical protein
VSFFDDYRAEVSRGSLTDTDIESLLGGDRDGCPDDDLRRFVEGLSVLERPPRDVQQMATALAATARASHVGQRRRGLRRLVVLLSAGAIVAALGGVALAADGAAPGDALYGVDRAFESVGIGAGGVEERMAEFDLLVSRGEEDRAFSMLAEVIEEGESQDSDRAQRHLELAATKTNSSAESAQQKVSALQDFIDKNRGPGVGLDGKDFGQCVSEIARTNGQSQCSEQTTTPEVTSSSPDQPAGDPGPPDNAGPKKEDPTSPDKAGPKDDKAKPSGKAGPKDDNSNRSENTGTGQESTNTGRSPDQADTTNESGSDQVKGKSADAPGQQKKQDG